MSSTKNAGLSRYWQAIGPGIVFAATSIGVSHVVQATRAGAEFGYWLVALVLIAHAVKLPFFQIGARYAAVTGESLLDAYQRIGDWAYNTFMLLTISTMFIVQAAVTIVAAGVLANIVDNGWGVFEWSAIVLAVIVVLLYSGGYRLLDSSLKFMMVIFAITCLVTLVAALGNEFGKAFGDSTVAALSTSHAVNVDLFSAGSIAFMVALVGWMPTTVEVSVWYSFWVVERNAARKDDPENPQSISDKSRESVFDFNVGYLFCLVFAMVFLVLGASLIFGTGRTLSSSAIGFTAQLIQIFVSTLGDWSKPVVSVLIFVAMFSTCIAVADGFSHVASRGVQRVLATNKDKKHKIENEDLHQHHKWYRFWVLMMAIGGWLVIFLFAGQLKSLVDFATTISFVFAPFFAYLNIKAMHLPNVPKASTLSNRFVLFSQICFVNLLLFSLFYIFWRFM